MTLPWNIAQYIVSEQPTLPIHILPEAAKQSALALSRTGPVYSYRCSSYFSLLLYVCTQILEHIGTRENSPSLFSRLLHPSSPLLTIIPLFFCQFDMVILRERRDYEEANSLIIHVTDHESSLEGFFSPLFVVTLEGHRIGQKIVRN